MSNQKPHILILPKWYPNATDPQLGIFVQNHANLISKEFNTSVIYILSDPNIKQTFNIEHTQNKLVNEIRITFKQTIFLKKIRQFIRYKKAQKIGLSLIKNTIDLVHVQVPIRPALLALKLQRKQSIPFLITEHWSGHLNGEFNQLPKLYQYIYKIVLSKAALISVVSQPLAKNINQLTKQKAIVIPNYISNSKITGNKSKSTNIEIVSVSDLNDSTKNIIGLLKGFKQAVNTNERLHLTIVGDGPDRVKIKQKATELNILNNVSFLGRKTQPEVQKLLHDYDFYVCNSNVETFGMTVAEALMAGKPVICTRCGGPESFVNSNNGLLVDINNEEVLSQAILKMANEFKNYEGSKISTSIKNKFGSETVLDQWRKVYYSILNE